MCKGVKSAEEACISRARPTTRQEQQELEASIEKALSCPCLDELKDGPCGEVFVTAFTCYHRSKAEPKGCDCLEVNLTFAECLRQHPEVLDQFEAARSDKRMVVGSKQQ